MMKIGRKNKRGRKKIDETYELEFMGNDHFISFPIQKKQPDKTPQYIFLLLTQNLTSPLFHDFQPTQHSYFVSIIIYIFIMKVFVVAHFIKILTSQNSKMGKLSMQYLKKYHAVIQIYKLHGHA